MDIIYHDLRERISDIINFYKIPAAFVVVTSDCYVRDHKGCRLVLADLVDLKILNIFLRWSY